MNTPTGLHHITAIASNPQANVDFYTGILGLRLVKKTVNFDDPSAYHLYYGDESGRPGSIITFFYWPGHEARGRVGSGQTTAIVFAAPATSLDFWQARLQTNNVAATRRNRFSEDVVAFADPDGIPVEIVAVTNDTRSGWTTATIPADHALRGMHTAELTVRAPQATEKLITDTMGYRLVRRDGDRARFTAASGEQSGNYIDVIANASAAPGAGGSGTVHHIAFSVPNDATELVMQKALQNAGYSVSEVRDRNYFHSIYYREPGGILFEIATANPGFAVDESLASLGTALKLPVQFERARTQIEKLLPPISVTK
ncbi:ring-cleaving dioxygenase [Rariglobus hedericola]|uniref:Ring-cleaving dioxygenase n=1 Tax=Rariglobus hedericola TaxID=2597822 RepID=A0A556QGM2_9BACT|nr:ring-cleaving dioxygenase [Rariglobus hedericola]TSJ75792.1 ring-cleaving dioxygenase [Rariglobus hedericola]